MKQVRVVALVGAALVAAWLVTRWASGPRDAPADTPPPDAAGAGAEPTRRPPIAFALAPTSDGRWGPDTCSKIPGGGMYSLPAFRDELKRAVPLTVGFFLGDVVWVPGDIGRAAAEFAWHELVGESQFEFVAAGPDDLSLGAAFARSTLAGLPCRVLCANAGDAAGDPVLRGWAIADAGGATVACVAVVHESLGPMITARGSDVRLRPCAEAAAEAFRSARAEAVKLGRTIDWSVLLVHGTVEETAAVVRGVPGLSFAFAARGDLLADTQPTDVGGVPVFYAGRGLRFGWHLSSRDGGPLRSTLFRLGSALHEVGSPIDGALTALQDLLATMIVPNEVVASDRRPPDPRGDYVGAARCAICHTEPCADHERSRHRRAGSRLGSKFHRANPQCLACHATGPFHRGGWRGPDDTSDLAAVSCEACHGPGSAHADAPAAGWGRVGFDACRTCHLPDRSPDFDPEEAWRAFGHGAR